MYLYCVYIYIYHLLLQLFNHICVYYTIDFVLVLARVLLKMTNLVRLVGRLSVICYYHLFLFLFFFSFCIKYNCK